MRVLERYPAQWNHRLRNLKTVELRPGEPLNQPECVWLIGRLVRKLGVVAAFCDSADSPRVIVDYDADMVSPAILLDFLQDCGLAAKLATRHDRAFMRSPEASATGASSRIPVEVPHSS